jgi:choloylglycine hydrolase
MFRKVSVVALSAALVIATTPGFACTGISLKAADGAAIRGRTLEFGFPLQSNVLVIPAGKEMSGTLADGGKGLTYTTRYDIVGSTNSSSPTALNDQGLGVGLFYFPGSAGYTEVTPENAKRAMARDEFGLWVLGNFATVEEVREAVKDVVLVPTRAPGLGSPEGAVPPVHFFVKDTSGAAIAVEPIDAP